MSSFSVPISPVISTVLSVEAMRSTSLYTSCMGGLIPMMPWNRYLSRS